MNEEWGTPISKEKIIGRRNRLIEYQKTNQARFTELYQIIDENILDINYMIYEIERLHSIIKEVREYIEQNEVSITTLYPGTGIMNTKDYVLEILDKVGDEK